MKTSGAGAVMASRREPPDSFDFFPTPPWATRALFVHVLKHLGVDHVNEAYDPACGQGHMAEVFKEFCTFAIASDIFDYGYGVKDIDFLEERSPPRHWQRADWYIFNPPFKLGVEFVLTALQRARIGVAALCRTAWLEGGERYRGLFLPYPPTIFAPFVERVPMVKGRWDPDASTATSYAWFVWQKGEFFGRLPTRTDTFWIPPTCKASLTKPTDRARFAAWSLKADDPDDIEAIARELCIADGKGPDAEVSAATYDTLTYRQRREVKTDKLAQIFRVPQWVARRREADDVVARFATMQALRQAA